MSDQNKRLVPTNLLPPGVKDERQDAFISVLDDALTTIAIETYVMTDPMKVDAKLLPFMVREFSVQEFVAPGLKEEFIRVLLSRAYELHQKKGYIEGTRLGLSLLGVDVTWVQWWHQEPKAAHNTHKVSVFFDNVLIDGAALGDHQHRNAVTSIIHATQRWSQSIDLTFGVLARTARFVGAHALTGARYVAALPANDVLPQQAPMFPAALSMAGGIYQAGLDTQ